MIDITRKKFIKKSSIALAGTILGGLNSIKKLEKDLENSFIDSHVHVWTNDIDTYPISCYFRPKQMQPSSFKPIDLFEYTKPSGVDRVVLIQMSYYRYDNSYMLDMIQQYKGIFSGVAVVDVDGPGLKRTVNKLASRGIRGFRVGSAETWMKSAGMKELWKEAANKGLAICPLINPEELRAVVQMCRCFPRTRVVLDHFARIGIGGRIKEEDVDLLCSLADFDNVYVKTSAFYALGKKKPPYIDLGSMIKRLKVEFGAERLMWGSDSPYQVDPAHGYHASIRLILEELDYLSLDERDWILRGTAEKVFFN